jgi:hypothetical protein
MTGMLAEARRRRPHLIGDESGEGGGEVAIYTLSDPRDVRAAVYVGMTAAPARRYLQHVRLASGYRSAVSEDLWWVRNPERLALHRWISELYERESLLPFMLVHAWVAAIEARRAERRQIGMFMQRGLNLFNSEALRIALRPTASLGLFSR